MSGKSKKRFVIERLFDRRWNETTKSINDPIVSLAEVAEEIESYNDSLPDPKSGLSPRNPANFFKDFVRNKRSANLNWPTSIFERGYTGRQITGDNRCFMFVPLQDGQDVPFPLPEPKLDTPRHRIESASLPLASRRLGRSDESWLVQVLVRLRVIETHLSLFSSRNIVQIDHLQMGVKGSSEIDALFLAIEDVDDVTQELIVCCEAKGRRDDILEDQIRSQVQRVFEMSGVPQDLVIPMAVKALDESEVYVVEYETVARSEINTYLDLRIATEAIYSLQPRVPGIGEGS